MKYFKLIDNDEIIGVITSDNFMHYYSLSDCYLRANEQIGEYVSFKGKFYRSSWMQPYILEEAYKEISIINITEEEYKLYDEALKTQETIHYSREIPVEETTEEWVDPVDRISLDFIRASKIEEMSYACQKAIENGFDLELRGTTYHFSLTIQDQLNLAELQLMAQTHDLIPYHADGEEVKYYAPKEIELITTTATQHKIYQTTYFNSLKTYINSLETIKEISAITYGVEIPEEYQSIVLKNL